MGARAGGRGGGGGGPGGVAPRPASFLSQLRPASGWGTNVLRRPRVVGVFASMLAKLQTFALVGIDAVPVECEVDVAAGLPKTVLVGLPEASVRESVHRVERALVNL